MTLRRTTAKLVFTGILALIVTAGGIAWFVSRHSIARVDLFADTHPVPKNAPTLNGADIEKILGVEHFRVIRRIGEIPPVVKESFSNFTKLPFDLADPGEEISTDMIIPGKSSRRLVFLGLSDDSAVLFYEQGGYIDSFNTVIFWFGNGGRGWGATLERAPIPQDISTFRAAVQSGKFHAWDDRE